MPKGVIKLENMFVLLDKFKGPLNVKNNSSSLSYEVINLGTIENPRKINLGKSIYVDERRAYIKLFKKYKDIFARSYQDIKTYDTRIIQHTIPLRNDVKPFQYKLCKFHPSLEPLLQKRTKEIVRCQNHCSSKVFCMGGKLGANNKKDMGDSTLCGF